MKQPKSGTFARQLAFVAMCVLILLRLSLLKDAMTCAVCRNELYLTSVLFRVIPLQREKEQQNTMKEKETLAYLSKKALRIKSCEVLFLKVLSVMYRPI